MDRRAFLAAASMLAVGIIGAPVAAHAAQKEPLTVTYFYLPG